MQTTAEQWCNERLNHAGIAWPLLQIFTPTEQRSTLLAGQAFIHAVQASINSSHEPDVVRHKLSWWQAELSQHATSVHPAFIALRDTGLNAKWDWQANNAWCNDLQALIEPNAPMDSAALWQQARVMAGQGMQLLIAAMQSNNTNQTDNIQYEEIADIATAHWVLQQINRFSLDMTTRRWIPLSLRARYVLRLDDDQVSAEKADGLRQAATDMLDSVIDALLALEPALKKLAVNGAIDKSLLRLLAMQRLLGLQTASRLRPSAAQLWEQPVKTLGPSSAWYCWRAVRQLH